METVTTGTVWKVDRRRCEPLSVGLSNRRRDGPRGEGSPACSGAGSGGWEQWSRNPDLMLDMPILRRSFKEEQRRGVVAGGGMWGRRPPEKIYGKPVQEGVEQCEGLEVGSKLPVFKDQAFPASLYAAGMVQGQGTAC